MRGLSMLAVEDTGLRAVRYQERGRIDKTEWFLVCLGSFPKLVLMDSSLRSLESRPPRGVALDTK